MEAAGFTPVSYQGLSDGFLMWEDIKTGRAFGLDGWDTVKDFLDDMERGKVAGLLIYPSTEVEVFTDPDVFLKRYAQEMDSCGPNGVSARLVSRDPTLHKAVDDLIYDQFGVENTHKIDYYTQRSAEDVQDEAESPRIQPPSLKELADRMEAVGFSPINYQGFNNDLMVWEDLRTGREFALDDWQAVEEFVTGVEDSDRNQDARADAASHSELIGEMKKSGFLPAFVSGYNEDEAMYVWREMKTGRPFYLDSWSSVTNFLDNIEKCSSHYMLICPDGEVKPFDNLQHIQAAFQEEHESVPISPDNDPMVQLYLHDMVRNRFSEEEQRDIGFYERQKVYAELMDQMKMAGYTPVTAREKGGDPYEMEGDQKGRALGLSGWQGPLMWAKDGKVISIDNWHKVKNFLERPDIKEAIENHIYSMCGGKNPHEPDFYVKRQAAEVQAAQEVTDPGMVEMEL